MATDKNKTEAVDETVETAVDKDAQMLASMTDAEKLGYLWAQLTDLKAKNVKREAENAKSPEQLEREQKKAALRAKIKEQEEWLNEKVVINLPFIPISGYKEDVFVSINQEPPIRIQRGEDVEIKRKYALLLKESQTQSKAAIQIMEKKSRLYANDERTLASN